MLPLLAALTDSITTIFAVGILAVTLGLLLKRLHQPYLIGYIVIGILLGPFGMDTFKSQEQIVFLGEIGIILLFFFIGMEISLPVFIQRWRVAVLGTLAQIVVSVAVVYTIGLYFDWSVARSVVIGFVVALSSSAVVIKLLEEKQMLETKVGAYVLSILLMQDIAIAPILIATSLLGGGSQSTADTLLQALGALIIIAIFVFLYKKGNLRFTFLSSLEEDHEMQVFMSIIFCAAGALLMGTLGLSPALGAFVGGMIVHAAQETSWIHDNLMPFRIIFVAVFFISVGAQIDVTFLQQHLGTILTLMLVVFVLNHAVNAVVLRLFGCTWPESNIGGAFMAQIGEMSFLVCFTAYTAGIISEYGYNLSICLISLTLLFSPLWILASEKIVGLTTLSKSYKANETSSS